MKIENDKKRIHESALSKRKALLKISKGENPKEIIINKTNSKDKKYSSKMLYKWKKEAYSKVPDIQNCGFGNDFCSIDVEYELSAFEFNRKIEAFLQNELDDTKLKYIDGCFAVFSDECLLY